MKTQMMFALFSILLATALAALPTTALAKGEKESMQITVTEFRAKGDGQTLNTAAVANALAALEKAGGGTLVFPAGEYLCGAVRLIENLTLRLEKGAVLKASPNITDHCSGKKHFGSCLNHYFLYGQGIKNLRIEGAGEINGNGRAFWEDVYFCGVPFAEMPPNPSVVHYNVLKPKKQRPVLLYLEDCQNITLYGVTLRNASCYTVWTISCREVVIKNVTIRNLRYGPNTDALDIDCTQNVTISHCDIDAGDDCIAVKSDPYRFGRMDACENIIVENCRLSSATCAIRIGYEGDAPIRNLVFKDLDIVDSRHGIDILSIAPLSKIKIDHGTPMDGFRFEKIKMRNVGQAFFIWAGNEPPRKVYDGHIRNLMFKNIQAEAVASSFIGSETPGAITDLTFENVELHVADLAEIKPTSDFSKMPSHWGDWWKCGGIHLHNAPGVTFKDCRITCDQKGFQDIEKTENIKK